MHKGNLVYVLPGGKKYHYKDDDCSYSSSIMKGTKKAKQITEDEAKRRGLTLCKSCRKEYQEDLRERPFGLIRSIFKKF
ncbi:hypothetical protein ABKP09_20020 [Peribacillus frigoritolerans]|uniref:hypothetical protein n=1 Tax=Peribacillus frigoritolerans TaxID=450367 RepID=UPI0032B33CE9